jgi:Tol biopolymer transport system component
MHYDPASDPVVRVDARRLRDKLREYYSESQDEAIIISLPKGSYIPSFEPGAAPKPAVTLAPEPVALPGPSRVRRYRLWVAMAIFAVLAGAGLWYVRLPSRQVSSGRPLTSSTGVKSPPSLSPDGNFVVFGWNKDGPADLWVKDVDSESLHRLTDTPQPEISPAWSPSGREIAFVRGGQGVFVISVLGGAERKIGETGGRVGWSADSKSVFVGDSCPGEAKRRCIFRIDLDTLERRQITRAGGHGGDSSFAASPDGRSLAIVRESMRGGVSDVYLVSLAGGEVRRITQQNTLIMGVDWTPDGKDLIYAVRETFRFRLWRTAASGKTGNGEVISSPGQSLNHPSVARGATKGPIRVAFSTMVQDVSIRRVDLNPSGPQESVGTYVAWADATEGRDCGARFSPDGNQVIFSSIRTGESNFWLANRDGSGLLLWNPLIGEGPRRALRAQEGSIGGWSPEGQRIAFDLTIDGNSDIYLSDLRGSRPIRLTSEPSMEVLPVYSRDGRWIYFVSDRSGSSQIWRMPVEGGAPTQLTFQGGFFPQRSFDGEYIYYNATIGPSNSPNVLKRVPATGGPETVVLEDVPSFCWSVLADGIYVLMAESGKEYLEVYDPDNGRRRRLGLMPFRVARGFCGFMTVAPDGRSLLGNHVDRFETNLGLLELAPSFLSR